ncbi:hypothetical protein [Campylobacter sp. RM16188]|uniref:hypothetical protein n=1 Tax=Campylobacter sp. RM16188 TaxID=1705725 RepID=UPI001554252C|nr:hypothetical protein [Campylobacter sp. RM16188]
MEKLKEKIISSYLFIVFIQRPFKGNGSFLRTLTSASLMVLVFACFFMIIVVIKNMIFYSDFKPLNELTKTTGLVEAANYWLKGEGKLIVKSDKGGYMRYHIDKRDKKIYEPVIGKRVTIYSKTMPLGEDILQLEDENGKIHIEYDYEEELKTPQKDRNLIYACIKIAVFLLLIVWFLNRRDFTKPKFVKPPKVKKKKKAKRDEKQV